MGTRAIVTALIAISVIGACIKPDLVACGDGTDCPSETVCSPDTAPDTCVSPAQIAACADLDGSACTDNAIPGWCDHGACVPVVCGNGRVDLGEVCDDGNQVSGDGCSGDCKSNEKCGNGIVDAIALEQCDDGNLVDHDACDSTCHTEQPGWQQFVLGPIGNLFEPAVAFDLEHQQAVLFGGTPNGTFGGLAGTWIWNGRGWTRANPAEAPAARYGAAMAYDADTRRVVLFGGGGTSGIFDDTWVWDGVTWSHLAVEGPDIRLGAAMVYDAGRKRIVLFGGNLALVDDPLNDTWEFDGTSWTMINTATLPPARTSAAMAYDPVHARVVMFGGADQCCPANTNVPGATWLYDGTDWTAVAVGAGPSARAGATMAWDATAQRIVLFGGTTNTDVAETWLWDGATWTPVTPAVHPAARTLAAMATLGDGSVLLVGGDTNETPSTTWTWASGVWTNVTGAVPAAQQSQNQIAFDARRDRAVMIDAAGTGTWESDGTSWTLASVAVPQPARMNAAMAYDAARSQTIAFGGDPGTTPLGDTWLWDGATWTNPSVAGPPARTSATLAYDAARDRVVLFGGTRDASYNDTAQLSDTWSWDGTAWTELAPAHAPPAREAHVMAYDPVRQQVVLFGGMKAGGMLLTDTWIWNGADWTKAMPAVTPSAAMNAAMVWSASRGRLVLFGGLDASGFDSNFAWEWDGANWSLLDQGEPPPIRHAAAMFPTSDGTGVAVFGGVQIVELSSPRFLTDTWRLRWDNASGGEICTSKQDVDGDGLVGCADPDCWYLCAPLCDPGSTSCPTSPRCGDGTCDAATEDCRLCASDCGACSPACGDGSCDPAESTTSCPGDCL